MTLRRMRFLNGFPILLFLLLCTTRLAAQTSDPSNPPDPNTATAAQWATWLNHLAPQAVPQETIALGGVQFLPPGTLTGTPGEYGGQHMVWNGFQTMPTPPACPLGGGGLVVTAVQAPVVPINSYNERYQVLIAKPDNLDLHDLQAVLYVPTLGSGSETFNATLEQSSGSPGLGPGQSLFGGILATIAFHPRTSLPEMLQIWSSAAGVGGCYTIVPYLQPQLGGFVVPYVPIAVIYQPQGCGQCIADTPQGPVVSACGSSATYGQATKHGTTVSWTNSSTSGIVKTASPQDFLGYVSQAASFASFGAGVIPGGQAAAGAFKTMGQVVDALRGLYNQTTTTTATITQSQTEARGWVITDQEDWNTAKCQNEDMVVYLQDVLFVYGVVPIDPVSGNVSVSGVPTVVLAPLKWNGAYQRTFSQLQSEIKDPVVLAQFRALDVDQGKVGVSKVGNIGFQDLNFGHGRPRLVDLDVTECPAPTSGTPPHPIDAPHDVYVSEEQLSSSGASQAITLTTLTSVSGLLASILGQAGQTTQSVTQSTDVTHWSSVTQEAELHLLCPELAPGVPGQEMKIQLDTLFDTLLAVPGPVESNTPQITGTITDQQGRPISNRQVLLKTSGKTYHVSSNSSGKYAFRFTSIPKGSGVLIAGNETLPINYNGVPLANQNFKVGSGVVATSFPGKTIEGAKLGNAVNPATPCCPITSIDAATGAVTAQVTVSGQSFQFTIRDAVLLHSLKIGQGVFANFKTGEVSVDDKTPCGTIVRIGPAKGPLASAAPGKTPSVPPAPRASGTNTACCSITAINTSTGIVTAKVNSSGQTFQFKVSDTALLHSLKIGQTIFANFKARQVSINGVQACCRITSPPLQQ